MKNSKMLLQIFFIFLLISIFSFYVVNNFSSIQEKFGHSDKFKALLVLLPTIPYILAIILLIFGWRYQDIGLLIATFSLIFLYYAFELSLTQKTNIYITAFALFPLNMIMAASSHKKKLLSTTGLFWMIIFAVEIYLILILCHASDIWNKGENSIILSSLAVLGNLFCVFMKKTLHIGAYNIPLFSALTFLFSIIVLLIDFLKNKTSLLFGYLLAIVLIFFTSLIPRTAVNITMFFIFAYSIILIAMIDSSFLLAYIDQLTGIPGRRSLDEDLQHINKKTAVVMIDIDFFKKFNDKYGHKTGDQALKMVASRLNKVSGNPNVYRYGGEEFTAIFSGKNATLAQEHMENFRKELEQTDFIIRDTDRKKHSEEDRGKIKKQNRKTHINVSIGIAFYNKELSNGEKLIKAADKALYKAKKAGRNRVKLYNKGIGDE